MAADLIDYLAEMALLKDIEARDARIAALESKLAASESKCAELEGQIACRNQLRNELATERAARADAERVAVWAAKNGGVRIHHYRNKHKLAYFDEELNETAKIEFNGHDPDLYRALVEACEGGE